mmetsp:Transcript_2004/g.4560  ORF Transcript_2004/g.4560 Transcript_2004/m.4560 type:complete len:148 (-) Transcript_2004:848-1291(-)
MRGMKRFDRTSLLVNCNFRSAITKPEASTFMFIIIFLITILIITIVSKYPSSASFSTSSSPSPSLSSHTVHNLSQPLNRHCNLVSVLEVSRRTPGVPDTSWGPGEDNCSGQKRRSYGEEGDDVGDREDHVGRAAILYHLPVEFGCDA